MVLEADRNGCVREVLVIAAALSIQDPRERPQDKQQAAAELHARFADEDSDFLAYLDLWDYLREQQQALSSSQFRRLCRPSTSTTCACGSGRTCTASCAARCRRSASGWSTARRAADAVHQSLLAGLLSHVGLRDARSASTRRARRALRDRAGLGAGQEGAAVGDGRRAGGDQPAVGPGGGPGRAGVGRARRRPPGEAHVRRAALGAQARAAVVAYERVTLYGVPIVARRKVDLRPHRPRAVPRELFLRHALVEGDWDTHHAFFAANRAAARRRRGARAPRAAARHRRRRRGRCYDFYDERMPADVVSRARTSTPGGSRPARRRPTC